MAVRAYIVKVEDHDTEIIYAESAGKAKGRGCTEFAFTERRVCRAPELDQYLAKGGPSNADLLEHGWWFECYWHDPSTRSACFARVSADYGGGVVDGRPYCARHFAQLQAARGEVSRGDGKDVS